MGENEIGKASMDAVEVNLGALQEEGEIEFYFRTKKRSFADRQGKDFFVVNRDGAGEPKVQALQVKSSGHGLDKFSEEHPDIKGVVVERGERLFSKTTHFSLKQKLLNIIKK